MEDKQGYHKMQAHLYDNMYVFLFWPKNTPLKWLLHARKIVDFQLDSFIENAARDEPKKEYARIEVESWFPKC